MSDLLEILQNVARQAGEEIARLQAEVERLQNYSLLKAVQAMQQMKGISQEVTEQIDAAVDGLDSRNARNAELERSNASLVFEVNKMRDVLKSIKRDFGHWSINAGTSTLDLYIGMVLKATNGLDSVEERVKNVAELFAMLTDEERHEIMGGYCTYCGTPDDLQTGKCQCWNDE